MKQYSNKANNKTIENLPDHIVQSEEWGKVKTLLGTPAVRTKKGVQFTLHKIPAINKYLGYCPKVNPSNIDWEEIKQIAAEKKCIAVRFDIPNNVKEQYTKMFKKYCEKAPKNTFAKKTIILNIARNEEDILKDMHPKTRYNIKLAQKKGVKVRLGSEKDIEIFLNLQKETAKRQGFYTHPDNYYKTAFDELSRCGMAYLLFAEKDGTPLVAWMIFIYKKVIYYVYGGSSLEYKNLMPSNLIAWETIKLGGKLGCKYFDMWGIANNPENVRDPWYGFTKFKLGFGGDIFEFEDSYDLVLNPFFYSLFNLADKIRWVLLKLKSHLYYNAH